ncbi:MAG: phage protein Gp36 family protein [Bacteroidota bacterium]
MAFLTINDLHTKILDYELTEITGGDNTLIESAISAAVSELKVYLNDSFDTDQIFNKTGSDRHQLLVQCGADIAIYFLVARVQAGQDVDDRRRRYDRAINWLKMVNKSETYADLPRREKNTISGVIASSNPKRPNYY